MLRTVLVFGLVVAAALATELWEDCSEESELLSLEFGHCATSPCRAAPGDVIPVSATFIAGWRNITKLDVVFETMSASGAEWMDVTSRFGVHADGCAALDPPCPFRNRTEVTFSTEATVPKMFEGMLIPLQISLVGRDSDALVCALLELDIE